MNRDRRRDNPPAGLDTTTDLAHAIEATLRAAARRNELMIGWVRVIALALTSILNYAAHLNPQEAVGLPSYPVQNAWVAAAWGMAAFALAVALQRGWYHDLLRLLVPLLDGVMVLSLSVLLFALQPDHPSATSAVRGSVANVAAVCTLLAFTGTLRLRPLATHISTGVAILDFVVIGALGGLHAVEIAFVSSILFGSGILGLRMSSLVIRSVESEVGRFVLRRFLPADVVERAHTSPLDLLGRPVQREATVLVSDLRNFTSFAENETPENVLQFLNEFQGILAAIVAGERGTVDKFMGDGMLAVFGAVEPCQDHARAAWASALRMIDAVKHLEERLGREIRIGIGIHSGPVIAGCLGGSHRLEFTTIGDTVNTASRLEALTKEKGASVLISETTAHQLSGEPLAFVDEVPLRGRTELLRVYTLAR